MFNENKDIPITNYDVIRIFWKNNSEKRYDYSV